MKKDIEIAHSTQLLSIDEVAASLGIGSDSPISPYQRKQYLSELRYVAKKVASIVSGKW